METSVWKDKGLWIRAALCIIAVSVTCGLIEWWNLPSNEDQAITWIAKAKHPIIAKHAGWKEWGSNVYTLISADGEVYATGGVDMAFPDTIKAVPVNDSVFIFWNGYKPEGGKLVRIVIYCDSGGMSVPRETLKEGKR